MKQYLIKFKATTARRPCFIVTTAANQIKAARSAAALAGRSTAEIQECREVTTR